MVQRCDKYLNLNQSLFSTSVVHYTRILYLKKYGKNNCSYRKFMLSYDISKLRLCRRQRGAAEEQQTRPHSLGPHEIER